MKAIVTTPAEIASGEVLIIRRSGRGLQAGKVRTSLGIDEIRKALATKRMVQTLPSRWRPLPEPKGEFTDRERRLLTEGELEIEPLGAGSEDPIELAAAEFAKLRNDSLTAEEAAGILHVSDGRIRQRLTSRPPSLFGIKVNGDWRIPKFQFAGTELVPGIEHVIGRLRTGLSPVSLWRWFSSPNPDLTADEEDRPLSPLEWLRIGRPAQVVAALAADL
jgi:hypothetical protein